MRMCSLAMRLFVLGLCTACTPAEPIDASAIAAVTELLSEEHVLRHVRWNGRDHVFVDYPMTLDGQTERDVAIAERDWLGQVRLRGITVAEEEGGLPEVSLVGTVNADRDQAEELVVQIRWRIYNYDVAGALYETRVFDQLPPDGGPPVLLRGPSERIGTGCDCDRRDEPHEVYRFKTLAAIRSELARAGFVQGAAQ